MASSIFLGNNIGNQTVNGTTSFVNNISGANTSPGSLVATAATGVGVAIYADLPIEAHSTFANGGSFYTHADQAFRGPSITLFHSRGTQSSPTTVSSGDNLGFLQYGGYDGSVYAAPTGLTVLTTETWGTTAHGSKIAFNVCANTTTAQINALTINHNGNVGIGAAVSTPTAYLHIKAGTTAANTAPLKFTTGSLNTTAEAGAVEFLSDDYYATITTGAARKQFVLNDGTNLTSGKIPIASTNGRLIDGQTPLAGTKTYWVSDTNGGAVNRKLTFIAGILTAET